MNANLEQSARPPFEPLVHVVQTELSFVVDRGDQARVLPEENVLAPAHFLAPDEKAGQRRHSGHGEHQGTAPHEGSEQELRRNGEADDHEDELRGFKDAGFSGHPPPTPFRIDRVTPHHEERCDKRDAKPPPSLVPAGVAREGPEGAGATSDRGGGALPCASGFGRPSAAWPSTWPLDPR